MNLTKIIRPYFLKRVRQFSQASTCVEATQRRVLQQLVASARNTLWGQNHGYDSIKSYETFIQKVAVTPYEEIRPLVMRMIAGEKDILWPGRTLRFAQSSGTSDGKSKYIPITADSLKLNHYRGGADVVCHYLNLYPDSRMFGGKNFILGGSFANELNLPTGSSVKVGDLSANLIEAINPIANLARIPSKKIALMANWHEKLPALVEAALHADVRSISGVPSWFLTVLTQTLEAAGATEIHQANYNN